MVLRCQPFMLELRDSFVIAAGSRTTTPIVIVELEDEGIVGYGEASMPPYRGETQETALNFLARIDLSRDHYPFSIDEILHRVDGLSPGNHAAKAALDIALHDWVGKKTGLPLYRMWGTDPGTIPATSFTIGIAPEEALRRKVQEASGYKVLKVKLGCEKDRQIIETVRGMTDVPLRIDANQGWPDRSHALRMVEWCAGRGVELVEQPLPRECPEDTAWLRERSPLPIIGDESIERLPDLQKARGVFDGVNIKLMKSTGLREALAMIKRAHSLDLMVMIGCMTETSCAISAASHLSPLADWVDLDGALLVRNDPFEGAMLINGRIVPPDRPGTGAQRVRQLPAVGP